MESTERYSLLRQLAGDLATDAERLRRAHENGEANNWRPLEDERTLDLVAERIDRFRRGVLRLSRQRAKSL